MKAPLFWPQPHPCEAILFDCPLTHAAISLVDTMTILLRALEQELALRKPW